MLKPSPSLLARASVSRLPKIARSSKAARRSFFVTTFDWRPQRASTHSSDDRVSEAKLSMDQKLDHTHIDDVVENNIKVFRDTDVGSVLSQKEQNGKAQVIYVQENDTVFHAIGVMERSCIGACLAYNSEGHIVGMLTERDYLRKIALKGLTSKTTKVKDIMSTDLHCVHENDSVHHCMEVMAALHIRHLPVQNSKGDVIGVVSMGDCLKTVLADAQDTAMYLSAIIGDKYTKG